MAFRKLLCLALLIFIGGCSSIEPPTPRALPIATADAPIAEELLWQVPTPPLDLDVETPGSDLTADVPGPGSGGGDERLGGWLLDALAAKDTVLAKRLWSSHRDRLLSLVDPLSPGHGGSWNIPVIAASGGYQMGDQRARQGLLEFLRRQLQASHPEFHGGLMGREPLSSLYWWPAPAIGAAHDHARKIGDREMAELSRKWLRAYTWILTLGIYPQQYGAMATTLCLPGARTSIGWECNPQVAFFWERSARRAVTFPRDWYNHHELWPARVTLGLSFTWLSAEDSKQLRQHRNGGRQTDWLLSMLQAEDIRLRTPFRLIRYSDGFAGWMECCNPHGSTPPLLGVVHRGGAWRFCQLWPKSFRGEGGRTIGRVRASVEGNALHCSTEGAKWMHHQPLGARRGDAVEMQLPLPRGNAIYDVTVDKHGARYSDAPTTAPDKGAVPTPPPAHDWAIKLHGPIHNICTLYRLLEGQVSDDPASLLMSINTSARNIANQTRDFDRRNQLREPN